MSSQNDLKKNSRTDRRFFLFLQGAATPFFDQLASSLRVSGIETCRVLYCGGDSSFHKSGKSIHCNYPINKLYEFYEQTFSRLQVTDIVLFGDTRPIHIDAIRIAKESGVKIHVFEEGYMRPDWITLDSDGVNANSSLANKPTQFFRQNAKQVPRHVQSQTTGYNQWTRLWQDIRYNIARLTDTKKFPHYKRHRLYSPMQEYMGWCKRSPVLPFSSIATKHRTKKLIEKKSPFFVYPLQLEGDSQIRVHSKYKANIQSATSEIIQSFSLYAHKRSYLIIKNHPLDTGISQHRKHIREASIKYGVKGRVIFLEGGHLPTLFANAIGTVVINSTSAMSSLFHRCPTIALGKALYDIPGLTFQGGLDDFWRSAKKPDRELFMAFRDVLIDKTQINGNFYTKKGIEMAVAGSFVKLGIPMVAEPTSDAESVIPSMIEQAEATP